MKIDIKIIWSRWEVMSLSLIMFIHWIKSKKATINSTNKNDSKCFQYAVTVGLNYEEAGKHSERITKTKPFIKKYNWEGIHFPTEKYNWKSFEKKKCNYCS